MSGRLFLLLFFVLQMAGTAVASWLLVALDGCWRPWMAAGGPSGLVTRW